MNNIVSEKILKTFILVDLDTNYEVYQSLFEHLLKQLNEFKMLCDTGTKISFLAHKLRSGTISFGATELNAALMRVEIAGRSGNSVIQDEAFRDAVALIDPTICAIEEKSAEIFGKKNKSA